jgi:hypothetical protein
MCDELVAALVGIIGTVAGTLLGYFLTARQNSQYFRRTVLRDIAFEYRRLAELRAAGDVQGLIIAGIGQCKSDDEYLEVLSLVDDLQPKIGTGNDWRPKNGRYRKFFDLLRQRQYDPTNSDQMRQLKREVESL